MALIFSTIPSDKLSLILKRSFLRSLPGIFFILLSAFHIRFSRLYFLFGMVAILRGFKPFFSIRSLEICPHSLVLDQDNLWFNYQKIPLLKIRLDNIQDIVYRETKHTYGITLRIRSTTAVSLLTKNRTMISVIKRLISTEGSKIEIFLPHFTRSALSRLKRNSELHETETN
ncbi:MAG: hypothetical protein RSB82_01835 [Victivallaceae bacterium]